MQLGIVGLPKVGKTTLFNTLTAGSKETGKFAVSREANVGVALVRDERLEALRELFQPRRYTPASIEVVDVPGLQRGDGADSLDLGRLREVDALVHVVRAFEDEEIPHPAGSVDPERDLVDLDLELILADHALVERRLERLVQATKRGLSPDETRERDLLQDRVLPSLEEERPLREIDLDADERRRLRGFQLLSEKPVLVVLNVGDDRVSMPAEESLSARLGEAVGLVVVSAPIEHEIAGLEGEDQAELLAELGLDEPSSVRLIHAGYGLLGLISFFTVGEDEVRAWTVRDGAPAREAAGKIHTDIARGFIRAEVVACAELLERGSLAACRDAGVLRLEGKEYPVRDGEVIHFRFNV
jgi:hypothetical protein